MRFLIDFFKNSYLVVGLTDKSIRSIEDWAEDSARLTSTDQMLVAAVIRNMGNFPEEWASKNLNVIKCMRYTSGLYPTIFRKATKNGPKIEFVFGWAKKVSGGYISFYDWTPNPRVDPMLNGMEIDERSAELIYRTYKTLNDKIATAKAAAAKALKDQKDNETKWNLVENLLDMERNEHGALVPRKQA